MFDFATLPPSIINGLFAIIGTIAGVILSHAFKGLRFKAAKLNKCIIDIAVLQKSFSLELKRIDERDKLLREDITKANSKADAAFRIMEGKQGLREPQTNEIIR